MTQKKMRYFSFIIPPVILFLYGLLAFYFTSKPSLRTLNVHSADAEIFFSDLNTQFANYQDTLSRAQKSEINRSLRIERIALKYFSQFLENYPVDTSEAKVSVFVKSILSHFESLPPSLKTDPDQILFIVRRDYGDQKLLELHLNKRYYETHFPEYETKNRWRGNVLSSKNGFALNVSKPANRGRTFVDTTIALSSKDQPYNLFSELQRHYFRDISREATNTYGWIVPGSWTPNHEPYLILQERHHSNRQEPTTILYNCIYNEQEALIESRRTQFDYELVHRVYNHDWLKVKNPRNAEVAAYTFTILNQQHLAKDIWLNGNYTKLYPLGDKFLYAYHLSNFTAQDSIFRHHKKRTNIETSIDYDLTMAIGTELRRMQNSFDPIYGAAAVCVVDGEGRIRAMPDLSFGVNKPNPNNSQSIQRELELLMRDYSATREQQILGNINLTHLASSGPGSTFKPVVYFSVMAKKNLAWNTLEYRGHLDATWPSTEWFAGKNVRRDLGMDSLKFERNVEPANHIAYLQESLNPFHSLILYLGAFTQYDLLNNLNRIMLPQTTDIRAEDFPVFSYNGQSFHFNGASDSWPKPGGKPYNTEYFTDENSVLSKGLEELNFSIRYKFGDNYLDTLNSNYFTWNPEQIENSGFISPALSFWPQRNRRTFSEGFQNPLLGSATISVTPLKMAELYLKIFAGNKNVRLTFDERPLHKNDHKNFGLLGSGYTSNEDLQRNCRELLYMPLHQAIVHGTASYALPALADPNLHYYAKTGTTGGKYYKADDSPYVNKFLALVISKSDLENPDLEDANKLIVVYISLLGVRNVGPEYETAMRSIVSAITRSGCLKNYMNE